MGRGSGRGIGHVVPSARSSNQEGDPLTSVGWRVESRNDGVVQHCLSGQQVAPAPLSCLRPRQRRRATVGKMHGSQDASRCAVRSGRPFSQKSRQIKWRQVKSRHLPRRFVAWSAKDYVVPCRARCASGGAHAAGSVVPVEVETTWASLHRGALNPQAVLGACLRVTYVGCMQRVAARQSYPTEAVET